MILYVRTDIYKYYKLKLYVLNFSRTDKYDVMLFHLATFIAERISSSVRNHLLGKSRQVLSLAECSCQSNKCVRHFRCQVALSLWKDAISEERRLILNCSFR